MDPNMNPVNLPLVSRPKLRELINMASPGEKVEPNVEGILVKIAEDFVSKVAQSSADLARHRKAKTIEAGDVQLHLERIWDLGVSGYGTGEVRKTARPPVPSEAHVLKSSLVQKERHRQ